jgi:hypothetical protein
VGEENCLPISSNYILALRPAIVLLEEECAHLIQRRESYPDLLARDAELVAEAPMLQVGIVYGPT